MSTVIFTERMRQGLTFSTVATFSEIQDYVNSDSKRVISFVYQYTGGQIRQERMEADLEKIPPHDAYFRVSGKVGYNTRNRSLIMQPEKFLPVPSMSEQDWTDYMFGLKISGSGILLEKKSFKIQGRASSNSCQVAFCGGTLHFKQMQTEVWALLPDVRTKLDFVITGRSEDQRDQSGNAYSILVPSFISAVPDFSGDTVVKPIIETKIPGRGIDGMIGKTDTPK